MTLQELQNKIKKFSKKYNLDCAPEYRVLDAVSELGEVAKEILKMTEYGKRKMKLKEEIKLEFGDLLYSVIAAANSLNIDLEEAINSVLAKYEKRFLKKGVVGSGK